MVLREEIVIKELNESCDECDDDPIIIGGYYQGELLFSECLHDESDRQNVIDDVIDTCLDIAEHKQAQD